jgi:hypothetical protein
MQYVQLPLALQLFSALDDGEGDFTDYITLPATSANGSDVDAMAPAGTAPQAALCFQVWVNTPYMVRVVRDHFQCSSLNGAEIEDDGGPGTMLQHLEGRIFQVWPL